MRRLLTTLALLGTFSIFVGACGDEQAPINRVGVNVIEMWHEIRRSMGAPVYQPVRDGEFVPSGRVRETQNDIFWKAGAS